MNNYTNSSKIDVIITLIINVRSDIFFNNNNFIFICYY